MPAVPEEELLSLAARMEYHIDFSSIASKPHGHMIFWTLSETNPKIRVHINYDGKISEEDRASYYTLPLNAVDDFNYQHPESSYIVNDYIATNEL